jgi:exodeoxyribonuclease VII large subunit
MPQTLDPVQNFRVISVAELNLLAKDLIERNLPLMWVAGEISNLTRAASGHCYFSLKDAASQVRCVIFRHRLNAVDWTPQNGMQVEVRALPSLYEPRGEFQLNVEAMRRSGLGELYAAFERLKAQLQAEGLFDAALKKPLPPFPQRVGIVTSRQAAALRDVLTTFRRRMPALGVVIYPTPVQGEGAGVQIAAALGTASRRAECDVLILCRGGGSIEDLWAFNEEVVARAVHACRLPVVCGVGHETDFTIADFVADARAPTPTAAAELVSPSCEELRGRLAHHAHRLAHGKERIFERCMQQLDVLARRLVHPGERIRNQRVLLGHLYSRLTGAWRHAAADYEWRIREAMQHVKELAPDLETLALAQRALAQRLALAAANCVGVRREATRSLGAQLSHLNPRAVLARGYGIIETAQGKVVTDSVQVAPGDDVKLTFAKGWANAGIREKG